MAEKEYVKRKPRGKAIILPEAESDEAATPSESDIARVDALVEGDEVLAALWNAEAEK